MGVLDTAAHLAGIRALVQLIYTRSAGFGTNRLRLLRRVCARVAGVLAVVRRMEKGSDSTRAVAASVDVQPPRGDPKGSG